MRRPIIVWLSISAFACGSGTGVDSSATPGAANCLIPQSQLVNGGPGRDGIPALNRPRAVPAADGAGKSS